MTERTRVVVFLVAAGGVGALLLWGLAGLPSFGDFGGGYTSYLLRHAVAERHATNVVMAVTFDYRGLDTMAEEFILFASVLGVALLLRQSASERRWPEDAERSDALRAAGLLAGPATVVVGLWLVAHGHLTPGGGFQGGVVLAAAAMLLYLAGGYRAYRRATPMQLLDAAESTGAGGFVAVGFAALGVGTAFLHNIVPYGRIGLLDSSGTIAVINSLVGLAVAGAFVVLFTEFLEELILEYGGEPSP